MTLTISNCKILIIKLVTCCNFRCLFLSLAFANNMVTAWSTGFCSLQWLFIYWRVTVTECKCFTPSNVEFSTTIFCLNCLNFWYLWSFVWKILKVIEVIVSSYNRGFYFELDIISEERNLHLYRLYSTCIFCFFISDIIIYFLS